MAPIAGMEGGEAVGGTLNLSRIKPRFPCRPTHSLATVVTELSWLQDFMYKWHTTAPHLGLRNVHTAVTQPLHCKYL